jgi:hypothetical protein
MTDHALFPHDLRAFINTALRTFAKTYAATWPHEYIVREKVDESLFVRLVGHIRANGYEGRFYAKKITYFDENGLTYWTMGEPLRRRSSGESSPRVPPQ